MKLLIYFVCTSIILPLSTIAQKDTLSPPAEIKIDPRQYVVIQYRKIPTHGLFDTIWNWEKRVNVSNQKYNFLDVDGELRIEFDKPNLIQNIDFEGTFSLEAEISSGNGTRKIEVNPYSEIGVQRIPIGIKSEPPAEIAKKLLNMLKELEEAEKYYSGLGFKVPMDRIEIRKDFYSKINSLLIKIKADQQFNIDTHYDDAIALQDIYNQVFSEYLLRSFITRTNNKTALVDSIKSLEKEYRFLEDIAFSKFTTPYLNALKYIQSKVANINEYVNSFEQAGEDARKAFLSLINKDLVSYKFLKDNLNNFQKKLGAIDVAQFTANRLKMDSMLLSNQDLIYETSKFLNEVSQFNGSLLEKVIKDMAVQRRITIDESKNTSLSQIEYRKPFYRIIDNYREELAKILSTAAGRLIYKRLVYATIDLGKSGAKVGEVLNVYLTWILDSRKDSLANSPRLPIGKYYLRETGWRGEVADMFALIRRIHESDVDQATVSPSNFKGSGGAVLMATFNKEDNGLKIEPDGDGYEVIRKNRLLNFLQPSIGLNVSYLDFSTEKDVEIGTGLQLGIFKNKIFFGYGVNLHMLKPKDQSPVYFYLGFSFARLSDLFKNSNNLTSVQ